MLEETPDEEFKVYMTSKTQGWFRRWDPHLSAAAAPGAAPGGAGGGAGGAATPDRHAEALVVSDDEDGADLISPSNNPEAGNPGWQSKRRCLGHTPSKTSRLQPAPLGPPSSSVQDSDIWNPHTMDKLCIYVYIIC